MAYQELTDIYQEDYRGGLVYTQACRCKTVTVIVSVAPDEQSHIISHAHNLPTTEEVEHLQGVDLYHFAVTDGTQIQFIIEAPIGNKETWYTVCPDAIAAEQSPIKTTICAHRCKHILIRR